ncbi:MAG: Mth938-like domain-containing protein [Candidatus Methylopumilus sp.]|jgi:uncharacterized protein
MKLHLTQAAGNQLITGYTPDWVAINHQRFEHSVIVLPTEVRTDWQVADFDALKTEDFTLLVTLQPEVVLLGTGLKHRFIHPRLIAALTEHNIAVECMTTDAACRTYNILMAEGRRVAAALIIQR